MIDKKEVLYNDVILILHHFNAHKTLLFEMIRSKKGEFTEDEIVLFIKNLGYSKNYIDHINFNLRFFSLYKDT
jgi:hypothetical protein